MQAACGCSSSCSSSRQWLRGSSTPRPSIAPRQNGVPLRTAARSSNMIVLNHHLDGPRRMRAAAAAARPKRVAAAAASTCLLLPAPRRRRCGAASRTTLSAAAASAGASGPSASSTNGPVGRPNSPTAAAAAAAADTAAGAAAFATAADDDYAAAAAYAPLRQPSELRALVASVPFRRLGVWGLVALILWPLHEFFGIAMGTFIVSFAGHALVTSAAGARALRPLTPADSDARRRLFVVAYFAAIAAAVTLAAVLTLPEIGREGADLVALLKSDTVWVDAVGRLRAVVGEGPMEALERAVVLATESDLSRAAADRGHEWTAERSKSLGLAVAQLLKGCTSTAASLVSGALKSVTRAALQTAVALVLGFFTLWDLPRIRRALRRLAESRAAPVYAEVAPPLARLGRHLGRALVAQARAGGVAAAVTGLCIAALQVPAAPLLTLVVFVAGFVPIAGAALSAALVAFVALAEHGLGWRAAAALLAAVGARAAVPAVLGPNAEAAARLSLHPLAVLVALALAEHALGAWGLLLAVPIAVFALESIGCYDANAAERGGGAGCCSVGPGGSDAAAPPCSSGSSSGEGSPVATAA